MRSRLYFNGMWNEALSMLERAERLHRQFARFDPEEPAQQGSPARAAVHPTNLNSGPTWEPPVDIVETGDRFTVLVALPGVSAESVSVILEPGLITVSATRGFSAGDRHARVHRLEIPFGRFVRRIALPTGIAAHAVELIGRTLADGCLTLTFRKLEVA